jgi:hypothetical protein
MIMSGGSKQPRCLPRCDRCFSVLFRRSSSAVVCLLVKRLSHGRKCLQPSAAGTASEHSSQTGPLAKVELDDLAYLLKVAAAEATKVKRNGSAPEAIQLSAQSG